MKKIGILGGMSWESTSEYYRLINQYVSAELGGLHSAEIIIYSFDFHYIEALLQQHKWDEIANILTDGARKLVAAGAELLVIATNTAHKVAEEIEAHAGIPLIHIADATGEIIQNEGLRTVGLLGTSFTMEEDFYRLRLRDKFGISVIIPDKSEREIVSDIIFQELILGKFEENSKRKYCKIIDNLAEAGAEGVILGCTEIPMLVKSDDTLVKLFDTTAIHARKIVDVALGSN